MISEDVSTGGTPRTTDSEDWIVAPATAVGEGAIAIVRLDGPGCWKVAERVWRPVGAAGDSEVGGNRSDDAGKWGLDSAQRVCSRASTFLSPFPEAVPPAARRMTLGVLRDREGERLDEAMAVWFPGPGSYTGNDLVEFHCHGSPAVVAELVDALTGAGARLARPGEFTERAFFNGRMDLAQAEGVANLIASRTREAGRAALGQLEGRLSEAILAVRDRLVDLGAEIEARLDFPEEEIEEADFERLSGVFAEAREALARLAATARRGRLFRDGARVAVAGKPNVGKSSLFNSLVGMERALVTPHPGTTRDTIEATVDVRGIPVVLIDTAGVRGDGAEEIESLGIERALREVERADLVLFVLDLSREPDDEDRRILRALGDRPVILVGNKDDLKGGVESGAVLEMLTSGETPLRPLPAPLRVSALNPASLEPLEDAMEKKLLAGATARADRATTSENGATERDDLSHLDREGATVINQRHEERLRAATEALSSAREAFASGASGELTMVDLNEALAALSDIVGLSVDDVLLDRIFSKFCIGK